MKEEGAGLIGVSGPMTRVSVSCWVLVASLIAGACLAGRAGRWAGARVAGPVKLGRDFALVCRGESATGQIEASTFGCLKTSSRFESNWNETRDMTVLEISLPGQVCKNWNIVGLVEISEGDSFPFLATVEGAKTGGEEVRLGLWGSLGDWVSPGPSTLCDFGSVAALMEAPGGVPILLAESSGTASESSIRIELYKLQRFVNLRTDSWRHWLGLFVEFFAYVQGARFILELLTKFIGLD